MNGTSVENSLLNFSNDEINTVTIITMPIKMTLSLKQKENFTTKKETIKLKQNHNNNQLIFRTQCLYLTLKTFDESYKPIFF